MKMAGKERNTRGQTVGERDEVTSSSSSQLATKDELGNTLAFVFMQGRRRTTLERPTFSAMTLVEAGKKCL